MTPEERAYRLICDCAPDSPKDYERMAKTGASIPDLGDFPVGEWPVSWADLVDTIRRAQFDAVEQYRREKRWQTAFED